MTRRFVASNDLQDEERLLCKVATKRDQIDAIHLTDSSGWGTLMAILETYGERPLKRPWTLEPQEDDGDAGSPSETLAKRFKQAASLER